MFDFIFDIPKVVANIEGKVLRAGAYVIRKGLEKNAELTGATITLVSDSIAAGVGLVSERGEQAIRDAGQATAKIIETPQKITGYMIAQTVNKTTELHSILVGDIDGEIDAMMAQDDASFDISDHLYETENAIGELTGENYYNSVKKELESLNKEKMQKQQQIDDSLREQTDVIQKILANINDLRSNIKALFREFEQLASVFADWNIHNYNIDECFSPKVFSFNKLKEPKDFFSKVDFDNSPWRNRLKGILSGGRLTKKRIEEAKEEIEEFMKAFDDQCKQAEEEVERYKKISESLKFIEENFIFFTEFYKDMIRELGYSIDILRESGYMRNMFFFTNSGERLDPAFLPYRHIQCLLACDKLSRLLCNISKQKYFNDSKMEVVKIDRQHIEKYRERFVMPLKKELAA